MSNLKDNINRELLKKGWTVTRLAAESGVPQPTIQRYLSGAHSEPRSSTIKKIANGLGLTEGELRGLTDSPKILSNAEFIGGFEELDNALPLLNDEVELPLFRETELVAGQGKFQIEESHGRKLKFSKSTLKDKGVSIQNAVCVKVSGNSMGPVIRDGCTVGIDTGTQNIKDGDIYAICHSGMVRIKRLYKLPAGVIRINSYNPDYTDEFYNESDGLTHVIGRVFWYSVLI
ncbi:helix-turn-helix transcriptional regulator [Methylovulum psychrotolerans]|uniref:XRE family transcriptional regulator n=1 Tax=Methylovulum psychrotolerans TaxID=1704499 RepID=UPI001BFF3F0B|nr:helix-turn-helix transcriptional regulator [Methylovulum psychrotolerans]MBT9097526.1 helix-turn-helix transcriptional regulator [Methylovulum psychrotolerans]